MKLLPVDTYFDINKLLRDADRLGAAGTILEKYGSKCMVGLKFHTSVEYQTAAVACQLQQEY